MLKSRIQKSLTAPKPKTIVEAQDVEIIEVEEEAAVQGPKEYNILVVDDEPNNITVISELLKSKYTIQASKSGKKAIDICRSKKQPDFILLDIMMPEMDGLEVCQTLKNDPSTEHIPIVFVSALTQTEDVVKGLKLGAVDYVTKPIVPEIFLARMDIHISQLNQRKNMTSQIDTLMDNMRLRDEIEQIFQHDLRNPLTAIKATIETIEEKAPNCEKETAIIKDSANVIENMVEGQKTMYQLEQGQYKPKGEVIHVDDFMRSVLFGLQHKCRENNVALRFKIPPVLTYFGDGQLSYNLFTNLINNAIEASPEKSEVKLVASPAASEAVLFTIHNQGVIPIEVQESFFDKFVTHGKKEETGIGTYSAKLATTAQGGEISFETSFQKGTTLKVTLPKGKNVISG
nr:hybrid sensor histidine kinase/response regulator [Marinifaba aquimaris]